MDEYDTREKFSFESYQWLKSIYLSLSEKMFNNPDDGDEIEVVCIYLLKMMLQMFDLVSDVAIAEVSSKKYELKSYYDERVFVLEERQRYEMQRLEKIWFGFLYAKSLINQANKDMIIAEQNCLFASARRLLLFEHAKQST